MCADHTGRYIYPLTVACQELDLFLWLEDPSRIKSSMGLTREKNAAIDATRIVEYTFRYSDKTVRYSIPDATIVSMTTLLIKHNYLIRRHIWLLTTTGIRAIDGKRSSRRLRNRLQLFMLRLTHSLTPPLHWLVRKDCL